MFTTISLQTHCMLTVALYVYAEILSNSIIQP